MTQIKVEKDGKRYVWRVYTKGANNRISLQCQSVQTWRDRANCERAARRYRDAIRDRVVQIDPGDTSRVWPLHEEAI